ncbi:MAG: hypothetical protein ACI8P9_004502 [Parasphingorhabdus sp.]|jgi:hypothetical protein
MVIKTTRWNSAEQLEFTEQSVLDNLDEGQPDGLTLKD